MKKQINIQYESIPERKIVYNPISIDYQEYAKKVADQIAYSRFLLNTIIEIYSSANTKNKVLKFPILSMMEKAFNFQYLVTINKIFDCNDFLSFKKLLNKLINDYKQITWYEKIDKKQLYFINDQLLDKTIKNINERVKKIRDQRLSHSDENPDDVTLKLEELEVLQEKAESIINIIRNYLCGISTTFDLQSENSLSGIIHRITAYEYFNHIIFDAKENLKNEIETEELYKILRGKEPYYTK